MANELSKTQSTETPADFCAAGQNAHWKLKAIYDQGDDRIVQLIDSIWE